MAKLQQEREVLANLLDQPEYATVSELIERRNEANRHQAALAEAIENLPHGATKTADMLEEMMNVTSNYGTVLEIGSDYSTNLISVVFTTLDYDSYVYWQQEIAKSGRFSFLEPPTFSGNGLIYTVEANMTATDFDMTQEDQQSDEAAENEAGGIG